MFREIIEAVGYDNIIKEVENYINPNKQYLFIRIPLDRDIDINNDVLKIKDIREVEVKDLELLNWFRSRHFFGLEIEPNKSISPKNYNKKTSSNQKNTIYFNNEIIIKKVESDNLDYTEYLKGLMDEYLTVTESEYKDRFFKTLEILENIKDVKNIAVRIFLDVSVDEYKKCCLEYLNNKLFIDVKGDKKQKLADLFVNKSSKKPFLDMIPNSKTDVGYDITIEEAINIYYLKKYLDIKSRKFTIDSKIGKIVVDIGRENKKVVITGYENIPYKEINLFEKKNLVIKNILTGSYEYDKTISDPNDFYNKINMDFVKSVDSLGNGTMVFKNLYEKYYRDLNEDNIDILKSNIDNFFKSLYKIHLKKIESKRLERLFTFEISLRDWLFDTNKKEEILNMIDLVLEKISNLTDTYEIESDEEFSFVLGQFINYVKMNSSSIDKNIKMIRDYLTTNKLEKIFKMLNRDFSKQSSIKMGTRPTSIMSALTLYQAENNLKEINDMYYKTGLLTNKNMMYVKRNKIDKKDGNDNE